MGYKSFCLLWKHALDEKVDTSYERKIAENFFEKMMYMIKAKNSSSFEAFLMEHSYHGK